MFSAWLKEERQYQRGGIKRGLLAKCFLNEAGDLMWFSVVDKIARLGK
ncbi:MAG: hypothetical protein IT544_00950 [Rhodobacteraceae bacterium]|nr:hypothetical protein [Paracoccaceae bacterium]